RGRPDRGQRRGARRPAPVPARASRSAAHRAGGAPAARGREDRGKGAGAVPRTARRVCEPSGMSATLTDADVAGLDAYWRAANYLAVGQIYLRDNPLLREPLRLEHVKPRLLGHWGTTPGLNLLYAHMNRAIRERDLEALFVTGPGHGGPGLVANTWLEG